MAAESTITNVTSRLCEWTRVADAGDQAFTLVLGDRIAPGVVDTVTALDRQITAWHQAGALPGLIEMVPTFCSLTVIYDPLQTSRQKLLAELEKLPPADMLPASSAFRLWRLPVCYEGDCGPDLEATAATLGISVETLIDQHRQSEYRVYMLGFLPGFPFMGDLPPALQLPRRSEPRLRVAPGSVAIAGALTAIYPSESPGGWHLLGQCAVPLFDPARPQPSLLQPGDRVCFTAVNTAEHRRLQQVAEARELDLAAFAEVEVAL
ncbi:5-oxoprolinase subunit PxpB [Candidatus Accumulibacter phosphatis]|jgi:inhibitor of KinA|uniref:5-oxoprolinase subunit PxpB n=1 Tax=Candidatus Accumulibacter phosphatis TaxID=327160 RepID=A0ABX1TUX7_9PROT|nr:5-oxoprolinase subunit PxpB [Candidatus Accumulibacter phosphatis]NMQ26523.1 5-oxoprolinase subunit PxpB [Candidatus Accumulibacter phosphatis]